MDEKVLLLIIIKDVTSEGSVDRISINRNSKKILKSDK